VAETTRFAIRGRFDTKIYFGVKIPRNFSKFWKLNAKFQFKLKHSNNFRTIRDRQQIMRTHKRDRVRVTNGDVISASDTTLRPKLFSAKSKRCEKVRLTWERLEIHDKRQCNTNRKPISGYRWMNIRLTPKFHLAVKTTAGIFFSVKVNVTELKTWNTSAIRKPQILFYKTFEFELLF
jgi:hypothetical protein